MSWDVSLIRTTTNTETIEQLDDAIVMPLDDAIVVLENHLSGIEKVDATWLDYNTPNYSVSFSIAPQGITLHIHLLEDNGEAEVMSLIAKLCKWFDCRAIDLTENKFLE